jgi:hypothetical protein
MKRKAIVIGAPGGVKNEYLEGVQYDFKNYINFLKSPTGGAWDSSEIIPVMNPSSIKLKSYLKNLKVDYTLVIFSGHGAYQIGDSTYIAVNRTDLISVNELVTKSPKQLLIIDACRSFTDSGISGFLEEEAKKFPSKLSRVEAKRIFKYQLDKCENGLVVCFSSIIGQSSYSKNDGGLFSLSLLDTAKSWVLTPSRFGILPIQTAFTRAKNYTIQKTRGKQVPELKASNIKKRTTWFPFAIRKPIQSV